MKSPADPNAPAPSFKERLIRHLVQPVPEELAVCEFRCSALQCSRDKWNGCPRRNAEAATILPAAVEIHS